jgi:hypothetical protein
VYAIPVFARLGRSGGKYRMPSGRLVVLVNAEQLESRSPVVTLRYLDDGEELEVSKAWFNTHGVPA